MQLSKLTTVCVIGYCSSKKLSKIFQNFPFHEVKIETKLLSELQEMTSREDKEGTFNRI